MNTIERLFKGIFFVIKVAMFLWVVIFAFSLIGWAYYFWIDIHPFGKIMITFAVILLVMMKLVKSHPVDNRLPDDHRKLSNLSAGTLKSIRQQGRSVLCKECGEVFWSDRVFYTHYNIPDCSHHDGVQTRDEYLNGEKWHSASSNTPMATAVEYKDFEIVEDNRWL